MKTKLVDTPLRDLKIVAIDYFKDERGFFIENWHKKDFADAGIDIEFIQNSHSRSKKNVIRGLHYQNMSAPMVRLVRCSFGRVFYVAVDIRVTSPTFGKWYSLELNDKNQLQLFAPHGFALGMAALTPWVDLQYKQAGFYNPSSGKTILWNDPDIGIKWPKIKNPIISEKDKQGIIWKQYLKNPDFK